MNYTGGRRQKRTSIATAQKKRQIQMRKDTTNNKKRKIGTPNSSEIQSDRENTTNVSSITIPSSTESGKLQYEKKLIRNQESKNMRVNSMLMNDNILQNQSKLRKYEPSILGENTRLEDDLSFSLECIRPCEIEGNEETVKHNIFSEELERIMKSNTTTSEEAGNIWLDKELSDCDIFIKALPKSDIDYKTKKLQTQAKVKLMKFDTFDYLKENDITKTPIPQADSITSKPKAGREVNPQVNIIGNEWQIPTSKFECIPECEFRPSSKTIAIPFTPPDQIIQSRPYTEDGSSIDLADVVHNYNIQKKPLGDVDVDVEFQHNVVESTLSTFKNDESTLKNDESTLKNDESTLKNDESASNMANTELSITRPDNIEVQQNQMWSHFLLN